jgi:hypothetical protein
VSQIARIERRQARIRRIREKLRLNHNGKDVEDVSQDPAPHHHIGQSQDDYVQFGPFLQKHAGDPAIKVCSFSAHSHSKTLL